MKRADFRLQTAARLMKLPEGADTMAEINKLTDAEKERLKGLVDWVEEYERIAFLPVIYASTHVTY